MFETGKRFNGYFDFDARCPFGEGFSYFKIPILFSFKVKSVEGGVIGATGLNPIMVDRLMADGQIVFLYGIDFRRRFLATVNLEDGVTFSLREEFEDRRRDFRYKFCPEFAGPFELYRGNDLISRNVFLESLSFSGLSSLLLTDSADVRKEDVLRFTRGKDEFHIRVLSVEQKYGVTLIRAVITESNVNIFDFNLKLYGKTFMHILKSLREERWS